MQDQVLNPVHKKHTLGVIIKHGMKRQIQHHHPAPEQPLPDAGHPMHALAAHEQHATD